jgi:hypothetical protein
VTSGPNDCPTVHVSTTWLSALLMMKSIMPPMRDRPTGSDGPGTPAGPSFRRSRTGVRCVLNLGQGRTHGVWLMRVTVHGHADKR